MQQAKERPGPEDYSPDPERLLKVALKVLVRAEEGLRDTPLRKKGHMAFTDTQYAINYTRSALDLLEQEHALDKPEQV